MLWRTVGFLLLLSPRMLSSTSRPASRRVLYTAFDEVPGPKGACTHILAFVRALAQAGCDVWLVTPGPADRASQSLAESLRPAQASTAAPPPGHLRAVDSRIHHVVFGCPDTNPLGRARTFRVKLAHWLAARRFDVLHCRSIFEGIPLLRPEVRQQARLVYEVNGFPSIEMKYHYARLAEERPVIEKLARQENDLLAAADLVLTVSDVNRAAIAARGVPLPRVEVIRNGVDLETFPFAPPPPAAAGPVRVAYVGTAAPWQGLDTLIEAVAMLQAQRAVELAILGPVARSRRAELERLTRRLHVDQAVQLLGPGSQADVVRLLHASHLAAVPLLAVDRNTRQGCSPLKLLEALAAGCPVVASDLPVVRELAEPERHLITVRAGDARHLKNGLLRLVETEGLAESLATAARQHVEQHFTWERAGEALIRAYDSLTVDEVLLDE
ncbi:MAG: glycosyltransferase family 4 protein [Pirellulales bacterium]